MLLTHEDKSNLRLLAAKADRLFAFGGCTTAVDSSHDNLVASLMAKNKRQQQNNKKQQKRQPPLMPPQPQREKYPTALVTLARDSAGLCFYHWSFSDKANTCQVPYFILQLPSVISNSEKFTHPNDQHKRTLRVTGRIPGSRWHHRSVTEAVVPRDGASQRLC